jgi:hypothetical protein
MAGHVVAVALVGRLILEAKLLWSAIAPVNLLTDVLFVQARQRICCRSCSSACNAALQWYLVRTAMTTSSQSTRPSQLPT